MSTVRSKKWFGQWLILADIDGIGGAVLPALHKGIEVEGMTLPPLYIIQKGVLIGVTNQADNLGISRTIPLFIFLMIIRNRTTKYSAK